MDDSIKQDLWRYALGRWQDKDFERACLHLQDEYQVPVALLLSGLWLAESGKQPDAGVGRRMAELAGQFEADYLRPLRAVRRKAGGDARLPEFKRQLQQVELEGERWLLTTLPTLCDNLLPAGKPVDAMAWLLVLVPETAQCEGVQGALNDLVAL
ncbi:TIGR02444 family protein [uncultured Alcanivorax sp.]|uniref:TIGR02444 family protein n=1 Tax=uncultured Alcanivorax sp. TaxID=191215 RepID=UPI002601FC01|nr:TIGR02444 family protein [uncultured Alcanivorax sp.]